MTGASAIFTQDIGADPSDADGRNRARARAGRVRRAQAGRHTGRDQTVRRRHRAGQERYGQSSRASSTATCPRRRRERCYSPPSTRPSQQANTSRQAARPTVPRPARPGPRNRRARGTRTSRRNPQRAAPNDRRARRADGDPNPAPGGANEPNTAPPEPNPHGARLRAIATARGVNDAELANLIRNAVAQGPIPAERARTALPEMLARITEEITERPSSWSTCSTRRPRKPRPRPTETTSVDFGALEPPQAA